MMKPASAKTLDEYAQQVFIPYSSSQPRSVSRVDLVRDTYKDHSLKGTARAKRGKNVRRGVIGKAAVPENWQNLLRFDSNKTELFSFLSNVLLQAICKEDKEVVVTDRKEVLFTQLFQDVHLLAPCSHENLIVISYCTYHMLHSMTIRCSFAQLIPILWSSLCLP